MRKNIFFSAFIFFVASLLYTPYSFSQSSSLDINSSSQATLKRKVAIARFSNETQSGTTFLVDDSGDRLGKQASDILSSKLAATGRRMI